MERRISVRFIPIDPKMFAVHTMRCFSFLENTLAYTKSILQKLIVQEQKRNQRSTTGMWWLKDASLERAVVNRRVLLTKSALS